MQRAVQRRGYLGHSALALLVMLLSLGAAPVSPAAGSAEYIYLTGGLTHPCFGHLHADQGTGRASTTHPAQIPPELTHENDGTWRPIARS